MKQYKIINAYQVINILSDNDKISYDVLWDLFQLKKKLQPHVDFYRERIDAIKSKFIPLADENGQLSGRPMEEYTEELRKLEDLEKEIDFEKMSVALKDIPGMTINMLEALEDFIDFKKE